MLPELTQNELRIRVSLLERQRPRNCFHHGMPARAVRIGGELLREISLRQAGEARRAGQAALAAQSMASGAGLRSCGLRSHRDGRKKQRGEKELAE